MARVFNHNLFCHSVNNKMVLFFVVYCKTENECRGQADSRTFQAALCNANECRVYFVAEGVDLRSPGVELRGINVFDKLYNHI